jgi:hypothetical protein
MSKISLVKKLGIKSGMRISIIKDDGNSFPVLDDLPEGISIVNIRNNELLDFILGFYIHEQNLLRDIYYLKTHLKKEGMIWISWPKKNSGKETDLNRDLIREIILNEGLVDIKVCSLNEIWSALKFVYRRKDRQNT